MKNLSILELKKVFNDEKNLNGEKIKVLFQNYDFDCSKTLHLSEVKALVKDLLEISCIYIPFAYSSTFPFCYPYIPI